MQAEGSSAESIAALAKVDTVKQRMEAAYETLQVQIVSDFLFVLFNYEYNAYFVYNNRMLLG